MRNLDEPNSRARIIVHYRRIGRWANELGPTDIGNLLLAAADELEQATDRNTVAEILQRMEPHIDVLQHVVLLLKGEKT
jgi:hypothetical protein